MARREVYKELLALFEYKPPSVDFLEDEFDDSHSLPNLFYDRHLDSRLALKHIKSVPSVSREMAKLVYDELKILQGKGQLLPRVDNDCEDGCRFSTINTRKLAPPNIDLVDATSVAHYYSKASHYYCEAIAATISLYPHAESWLPMLYFGLGSDLGSRKHPAVADAFVLRVASDPRTHELEVSGSIMSCLNDDFRAFIRDMAARFQTLAVYQFHVPLLKVEQLFREMDSGAMGKHAPSLQWPTLGFEAQSSAILPQFDSRSTIQMLPSIAISTITAQSVRRSVRINSKQAQPNRRSMNKVHWGINQTWPTVVLKLPATKDLGSIAFVLSAWTRSAKFDTTIIVFNCGKYERIGFRHRESQTLFLSGLIDISHGSEPSYGQVQIGLYMTILRDALDRTRQMKESSTTRTVGAKRKRSEDTEQPSQTTKRHQTRSKTSREGDKLVQNAQMVIVHETRHRSLALLRIQYGAFNSPAPATLFRTGHALIPGDLPPQKKPTDVHSKKKKTFTPKDYFCITLTSDIARGATGRVHDAQIKVQADDGQTHSCGAVVKIALEPKEKQKLGHEFAVYHFLATKKVKRIALIYGLFEDTINEALIMVMSHVGLSLVEQPTYRAHRKVILIPKEKDAFKEVLTEIHQAGVRHYDIRPENLMMDADGNATIIDFDLAKVCAGRESRQREFKHLCFLLNGSTVPPNQWESPATSAGTPPADDAILDGRI